MRTGSKALLVAAATLATSSAALADGSEIARGRYLVTIGGCSDCHTPGSFLGKPDLSRMLGGSEVGFAIPGLGVFPGPNLTPDKETGLGDWTDDRSSRPSPPGPHRRAAGSRRSCPTRRCRT